MPDLSVLHGTALPVNSAMEELQKILLAGARGLKSAGRDMVPVRAEMLTNMTDAERETALEVCDLLFAAAIEHEHALMAEQHARSIHDAAALVQARMRMAKADGIVLALFHGPTALVLVAVACTAPIAFHQLAAAAPALLIRERCQDAVYRINPPKA